MYSMMCHTGRKKAFLRRNKCLCSCGTQELCTQEFLDVCGQTPRRLQQVHQVSEAPDTVLAQKTCSGSPGECTEPLNPNQRTFSRRAGICRDPGAGHKLSALIPPSETIRAGLKQLLLQAFQFPSEKLVLREISIKLLPWLLGGVDDLL